MVTGLGANFAFGTPSLQPYFQIQPSSSNMFFYICHVIKLIGKVKLAHWSETVSCEKSVAFKMSTNMTTNGL
jgi:hypothetical protein